MQESKSRVVLLAVLLALIYGVRPMAAHEQSPAPRFSNINIGSGLSQKSVMKIYQDDKGYMWFGTRNGLNKYDGGTMKVYKPSSKDGGHGLIDRQITALVEDKKGNLWIGTSRGLGCLNMATDKIKSYTSPDHPWLASGVRSLFVDNQDRVWIGTARGLYLFEPETELAQPLKLDGRIDNEPVTVINQLPDRSMVIGTEHKGIYLCDPEFKNVRQLDTTNLLPNMNVADILVDGAKNEIWVATAGGGVARVNLGKWESRIYNRLNSPLSTDNTRALASNGGGILIGTFDGLYNVDKETGELSALARADKEHGNLSHFSIYSLCVDRSGGVWVGTYSGGADYYSPYNNRFTLHEGNGSEDEMISGVFGPMTETVDGMLYVATEGGGLLEYDKTKGKSTHYLYNKSQTPYYSYNILKSIFAEGDTIWCGTTEGTICAFDKKKKTFTVPYKLSSPASVYAMMRGSDGCLWVATSKPSMGVVRIQSDGTMQSDFMVADTLWHPRSARCLLECSPGVILIGSRNNGLYEYDMNKGTCVTYNASESGNMYLPSNYVTSILTDRKGRIWVSTLGGGLNLYEKGKGIVKSVTTADGLGDDDICMAVEDADGRIWLSASNYIMSYAPDNGEIHNYGIVNDIGAQEFTPHSGLLMDDGEVGFSAGKGFVTFNPSSLKINSYLPPVVFTDFEVNNTRVVPEEDDIISVEIDDADKIELAYNQNNISISYAALNYVNPDQNTYAIRMKGYDDEWHEVGNRRSAYYTNLKPGKYVFEVKAANNDGVWNDNPRSLTIIVRPPIWATWYAYLLYAILFFGTCFLITYYIIKKKSLEERVRYQRMEQERSEEFHRTKLQMFTNFSHELRTPLTLILSPLEELLHRTDFNHGVKNKLSLIYNNSQRMLILVNQLMDLRKSQSGNLKLKVSKEDLCSFMQEMYCAFNNLASTKDIKFEFESSEERLPGWFDKSVCDKVMFNLLSNAFKFTHPGDKIIVGLDREIPEIHLPSGGDLKSKLAPGHDYVHISVRDTGRGIPDEDLIRIFDPFYQVEGGQPKDAAGTGIGLSLTKMIVELHHGIIWAENNKEGGATFHVVIPVDKGAYSDEEFDLEAADRVVVDVIPSEAPKNIELDRRYAVLLVEDNEEVRTYVKECLLPYFDVIEADNGETAFELAVEKYPDIIVSDIMMPRKNGLELCAQIKEDLRTEHIPVILMTARCMVMHIKEGFSSGADDYIVKPFSMDVLIYRIRNILSSREKLKKLYGKKFSLESLGIKIVSAEDKFTQKFFEVIESNISNPDLNIDMICREVGLSRTNLYRKLKAITDLSPVELIRNKRLEVATRLLKESDYTVSEISTYVGFNSHAYFTQCFKAAYGCSPSDYLAEHRKGTDKK